MYTNELLEEKARAQRILISDAEKAGKDYMTYTEDLVRELYRSKGWALNFVKSASASPATPSGNPTNVIG